MIKKSIFALFFLPIFCHLFQLFFLHFDGTFSHRTFNHGFKKTYITGISGQDYEVLDSIFSQPFTQLGQGKQMTAFASADNQYVLKLFNPMQPLKKKWYTKLRYWRRYSSLKWLKREWFGKTCRLEKLFRRHKIALELLKEETGLVFVHIAPSKRVCHQISAYDTKGKKHLINLANAPFILQKKATLVPEYLNRLITENRLAEAGEAVKQIETLFEKRLSVGITDRIQTMENNYGFIGNQPIQIDVGRIRVDPALKKEEERQRILHNFHTWIASKYSSLE